VVGLPSASSAQPSGIARFWSAASFTDVHGTAEEDWSIRNAILPFLPGTAKDSGLVPITGFLPPTGAIAGVELVNPNASSPCFARKPV
jgi:hypothetical protein